MKNSLLCLLLTLTYLSSRAQVIEKNRNILGGAVAVSFTNNEVDTMSNQKDFRFQIIPSFGKAIKKNLVLGVALNLATRNGEFKDHTIDEVTEDHSRTIGGRIFIEKFFPLGRTFSFSANAGIASYWGNTEGKRTSSSGVFKSETDYSNIGFSAFPAVNYSLNSRFLIQFYWNDLIYVTRFKSTTKYSSPNAQPSEYENTITIGGTSLNQEKPLTSLTFAFRYIF